MEVGVNTKNKTNGFTLVEILVSILLLTVVLLGIVQSLAIYTRQNIRNIVRDEAVRIAQECMENLRNNYNCNSTVTKNFRNFSITYQISAPDVATFTSGNNNVQVSVTYTYPPSSSRTYTYTINSVVYKP